MFGFLIKKSFCDGWDNLFSLVAINILSIFLGIGILFGYSSVISLVPQLGAESDGIILYFVIAGFVTLAFVVFSIIAFSFGELAADIADFSGIHLVDFFKKIPSVLKDAVLYGVMLSAVLCISVFVIYWYFSQGSLLYLFLGGVFLWADIFFFFSIQWFIPIRSLMKNNFKKCLKKSFLIFLDNTRFSIGMSIYTFVMLLFSILFIGFIPSVSGIILARTEAMRLRLYKYDYLEAHPEINTKRDRKKIPWEELLFDDKETLGPRKLKSFLFPWKE